MIERCPFCTHIVAEEDLKCPSCDRDLSFEPPPPAPPPKKRRFTLKPQAPSFVGYPSFLHEEKKRLILRDESPFGRWISRRSEWAFSLAGAFILFFLLRQYYGQTNNSPAPERADVSAANPAAEIPPTIEAPRSYRAPVVSRHLNKRQVLEPPVVRRPVQRNRAEARSGQSKNGPVAGRNPWVFHGIVYDLTTLEPVKLVHVVFRDEEKNKVYETYSRFDGRFRMVLPAAPGRGYFLEFEHAQYQSHRHLLMEAEKIRNLASGDRKVIQEDLYKTLENLTGVTPPAKGTLDVWLVPRKQ